MSSNTDGDGYVHVPDRDDHPNGDPDLDADASTDGPAQPGRAGERGGDGFGGRGWALVIAVVVSVLVIPGVIYVLPGLLAGTGVPFIVAMLVLPLAPAALLGVVAVWSMAASNHR